jgi:hypothetical protein
MGIAIALTTALLFFAGRIDVIAGSAWVKMARYRVITSRATQACRRRCLQAPRRHCAGEPDAGAKRRAKMARVATQRAEGDVLASCGTLYTRPADGSTSTASVGYDVKG